MFAIHRVNYDGTLSASEVDGVVRAIEHTGYILPQAELVRQGLSGNMCFGLDYLAGDCEYMFLKPTADDWQGWLKQFGIIDAFVFDLDILVKRGAIYGSKDLLEDYNRVCFDAATSVIGNKLYRLYVSIFYDLLFKKAYGISMSVAAKRAYDAAAHGTKMDLYALVDDIIDQGLVDAVINPAVKACQYIQRHGRLTGQFSQTIMSKDSSLLNRLLQVAINEGWKSQHVLASELGYEQVLGREVLFPGPLPVALAISCP